MPAAEYSLQKPIVRRPNPPMAGAEKKKDAQRRGVAKGAEKDLYTESFFLYVSAPLHLSVPLDLLPRLPETALAYPPQSQIPKNKSPSLEHVERLGSRSKFAFEMSDLAS